MSAPIKKFNQPSAGTVVALAGMAAAAATALWVRHHANKAVRDNPPLGRLITVDDVRLHYIDVGKGPPVVLLHGNTLQLQDYLGSGLVDALSQRHRVILFDRPGFGHSERPRDRLWTPQAQAALLRQALVQLGVERPVVVGIPGARWWRSAWRSSPPRTFAALCSFRATTFSGQGGCPFGSAGGRPDAGGRDTLYRVSARRPAVTETRSAQDVRTRANPPDFL